MVFNILIVITTDLIFLLTSKGFILLILCYVYFLLLGLILTAGFLRIGCQFSNNSAAQIYRDGGLSRLCILAFLSATLNMLFLGVQTYSVIQFDVLSEIPRAWPWYAVQALLRAFEVSMCFVMIAIVFNNRFSSFLFCCKKFLPKRFNNTVSPLPPGFAKAWTSKNPLSQEFATLYRLLAHREWKLLTCANGCIIKWFLKGRPSFLKTILWLVWKAS